MANILGQMFFQASVGKRIKREFGWNEGHIMVTAANLKEALVDLQTLANYRKMMLGMNCAITYLRVSDIDVYRDSQVTSGPLSNTIPAAIVLRYGITDPGPIYNPRLATDLDTAGPQAGRGLAVDFPDVGYLLRMEGGTTYQQRRSVILRGNPDVANNTDEDSPSGTAWSAAFQAIFGNPPGARQFGPGGLIFNGKYGFMARAFDTGVNPLCTVEAVSGATPPVFTITPSQSWPKGTRVQIRGVKPGTLPGNIPSPKINGTYTVATNDNAGHVTFVEITYPVAALNVNGKAQRITRVAVAYNNIVSRRWGMRKTGRPFDLVHGRLKRAG